MYLILVNVWICTAQKENPSNQTQEQVAAQTRKMQAYCHELHRQSPVNLLKGKKKKHQISFNYMKSHEVVLNLGHTVELKYDEGSFLKFDDKTYQLIQMHFHTPSEHWIERKKFSMEAHLVHKSTDDHYLVLAILFEEGQENKFLANFINDIPQKEQQALESDKRILIADLLPKENKFFTYSGSLTTPPYTEGVLWVIFQKPLQCTSTQLDAIKKVEGFNARNLQKLNHRKVNIFLNE